MNRHRTAALIWSRRKGPHIIQQRFRDSAIARHARAGQFVHLLPGDHHLFRRAFSVYATDPAEGTFDILYQVMGRGTTCLSGLSRGTTVDVLGPLGNRFRPPAKGQVPILVGGGLGMAPLRLWAVELASGRRPIEPVMILGARTRELAIAPMGVASFGIRPFWATDDGSRGYKGTVVDLLAEFIGQSGVDPRSVIVYGCGPEPMMKALGGFCERTAMACQLSLERSMPCGFGVCMCCVVTMREADGYDIHRRVCRDGPVFDAETIVL